MHASNAESLERRLGEVVTGFGLGSAELRWDRLGRLVELWKRFGRAFNLSGALDDAGLLPQLVEGLQVVALARKIGVTAEMRWLDVGSGAGFPGLIVAACLPVEVTFVEPRERRAGFLDLATHQIGRPECRVVRGHITEKGWRAVRAGDTVAPGFDWAGARAVFAPETWVELGRRWIRPEGVIVIHVRPESPEMRGTLGRVDGERWSVRGIRGQG